ncbi:YTH domain-containing protein ECT1-like [Salvia miltiorrhiza]|uniref:YTH domain-containing protein ECT1-like n=1 Tax=Salvia miltiorrhiza TaxID=226208 RepID=UPI0025AD0B79|nr:YTH domain-containing protein ECT1-like [Salvia miltiorrhiza]
MAISLVNVFGQLCGMAEMSGQVDFQRDMDLDRSGSFPLKWHIIKDLSHLNPFRDNILQNNENMPVIDNRDIQRISFDKGLGLFSLFKGHTSKTSLLSPAHE